jgi:regulator of CtrA degradation
VTDSVAPTVTYFDNTFEEALALAREARNYIVYQDTVEAAKLDPAERLVVSCESMRVTARVGQIIAWLLVQKAVHAGELSRDKAAEAPYRLSGQKICSASELIADEKIPLRLAELLERSHSLYTRVERLDAMLGSSALN